MTYMQCAQVAIAVITCCVRFCCLQLELDAINRIVTVKKEDVLGKTGVPAMAGRGYGYNPGARPAAGAGYGYTPSGVPRTPAHVMATPMHPSMGGSTPVHPSRVSVGAVGSSGSGVLCVCRPAATSRLMTTARFFRCVCVCASRVAVQCDAATLLWGA